MAGLGFLIFQAQEQGWGCGEESSPRTPVPRPSWPQTGAGVLLADLWTRGRGSLGGAARLRGDPWHSPGQQEKHQPGLGGTPSFEKGNLVSGRIQDKQPASLSF